MKRNFIINFVLMFIVALVSIAAVMYSMWFTAIGAMLICIIIFYMQIQSFYRYDKILASDKISLKQQGDKLLQAETQLHFYKAVMDKVDMPVIISTGTGYVEWSNFAAKHILPGAEVLPVTIINAIDERCELVKIEGTEYALSCQSIIVGNSERNIIVLKNIHMAIERNRVEAWHKLVRVLTHEIMNSMTPIISLSSTLCRSIEETAFSVTDENIENLRYGLQVINRRSNGLLSFVENYRKLTHLAAPQKSEFLIEELINDIRMLFAQPFIEFKNETARTLTLCADRSQIEQVIINLLKNAVEACEARAASLSVIEDYEKHIVCTISRLSAGGSDKGFLRIAVADNGVGVLASVHEQMFVPFFTTKKSGSGIGLSLCKQIIINHNGNIDVCSEPNCGCTVVSLLPM